MYKRLSLSSYYSVQGHIVDTEWVDFIVLDSCGSTY